MKSVFKQRDPKVIVHHRLYCSCITSESANQGLETFQANGNATKSMLVFICFHVTEMLNKDFIWGWINLCRYKLILRATLYALMQKKEVI